MKETNSGISVIILTFNEEKNISLCIDSLSGLSSDIFIVDSGSTDKTLEIAKNYTDKIYSNKFENYSQQRNWALDNLPISSDWVMNIDADHRVTPELSNELQKTFSGSIPGNINGFLISRRTVFMGRWIRHGGHYPAYHAVLFRRGYGRCEDRKYDQHFVISGEVRKLNGDIIDVVTDSLSRFTTRHNVWSDLEADEHTEKFNNNNQISAKLSGNQIERKRFLKISYYKFPLFLRAFLYFCYRYFFRLGFMDGKEGLIFHFLQGFWFRFLVDAKIYERIKARDSEI